MFWHNFHKYALNSHNVIVTLVSPSRCFEGHNQSLREGRQSCSHRGKAERIGRGTNDNPSGALAHSARSRGFIISCSENRRNVLQQSRTFVHQPTIGRERCRRYDPLLTPIYQPNSARQRDAQNAHGRLLKGQLGTTCCHDNRTPFSFP